VRHSDVVTFLYLGIVLPFLNATASEGSNLYWSLNVEEIASVAFMLTFRKPEVS